MKRYLLIHQAFVGPDEAGGTRHLEFANQCVRGDVEFVVVASSVSYLTGKRRDRSGDEGFSDGVRVIRAQSLPILHKNFLWRVVSFLYFSLTSLARAIAAGPFDVVMGTSPPLFQGVSSWIVARLRKAPFLLEIRDLWPEFAIDMGVLKNPLLIWMARRLERFLYTRATHLLVNSPAYRDYLLLKGIPERKISFIPNGADPNMFDPGWNARDFRTRWGLQNQFVATYAGALGAANDISTILNAAQALLATKDIRIMLVGDGKERARLETMAAERRLSNVTFTGALPKTEMKDVLAASDVCLATLRDIPTFRTTYPNKVFDYMAAGRPVILAIDGVIREVVESASGGICVPPGDAEALAGAVRQLYLDPRRKVELGESARAYVVEHFHRRTHARSFEQLLQDLANRGTAGLGG